MKIFVDTANLADIEEALKRGFVSGITTNPSILAKEPKSGLENHVGKIVDLIKKYDVKKILDFPVGLASSAGQDALWSIALLLGAIDGINLKQEVLSYEGPFGVGYMVAKFE